MQLILSACKLTYDERLMLSTPLLDYTLKEVDTRHDYLTSILINCHEKSEEDESLLGLNREIWSYLKRHSDRHAIKAVP